jgi:hypothetical protein
MPAPKIVSRTTSVESQVGSEGTAPEGKGKARSWKGEDDDDEDDDEEEELGEQVVGKELEEIIHSSSLSEDEKRMGCILKRLLSHRCAEKVGTDGSQSRDVESSLSDYVLQLWRPLTVAMLASRLKDGEYAGEGGIGRLARHVNLMCRNSWTCNIEDSEPWSSAEKFLAVFDRLLKAWILDEDRPDISLLQIKDERCFQCGTTVSRDHEKVSCSRCSLSLHSGCMWEPAADDCWVCGDCVNMTVRNQVYPTLDAEPDENDLPELKAVMDQLQPEMLLLLRMGKVSTTEWGPSCAFPPLLDGTINRTVMERMRNDADMLSLATGLAILTGRTGGLPEMSQHTLLLEALCILASNSQLIKTFLDGQDHRIAALRRRLPDDENLLRYELREVGGDEAVLAWKDPVTEEVVDLEEEPEEEAPTGFCVTCKQNTEGEDPSTVVLCNDCPSEIHLRCLDPSLTEAPEKDWWCPPCRSLKFRRKHRAIKEQKFEDVLEAERAEAENRILDELIEERIEDKAKELAGSSVPSRPNRSTCEYCSYSELELCSPLVLGQTPEETEEHLKASPSLEAWAKEMRGKKKGEAANGSPEGEEAKAADQPETRKRKRALAAAEEDEGPPPLVPYFPRVGSADARKLPPVMEYPIVHERCAIQIVQLRAKGIREREEGMKEGKEEKLVDDALRISGTRTYPLGEDRSDRSYWRLAGEEDCLFAMIAEKHAPGPDGPLAIPDGPRWEGRGRWLCYEKREDIEALVKYLDPRSPKEGPLRAAIEQEFLAERPKIAGGLPPSAVIRRKPAPVEVVAEGAEAQQQQQQGGEGQQAGAPEGGVDGLPAGPAVAAGTPVPMEVSKPEEEGQGEGDDKTVTDGEDPIDVVAEGLEGLDKENVPIAIKFIEDKCTVELPTAVSVAE